MGNTTFKSETALRLLNDKGDKRWYTAMMQCENGNLQGAARLVNELLNEPGRGEQTRDLIQKYHNIDQSMANHLAFDTPENGDLYQDKILGIVYKNVILYMGNEAALQDDMKGNVLPMFKSAVALGITEMAYNLANGLLTSASNADEYREADEYFKIAIECAKTDSQKAAAMVNGAAIIVDGKITGTPDIPGGIALYRKAGELGQITGMYNAAYYSIILAEQDPKHYEAAEYWLERLINRLDDAEGLLSSDVHAGTERMIDSAFESLAKLHIAGRAKIPDLDYAESLIRSMKKDCPDLKFMMDSIYSTKLRMLEMMEERSDAAVWAQALKTMGFVVNSAVQHNEEMGIIMINRCDGSNNPIVLMVVNDDVFDKDITEISEGCKRFLANYVKEDDHELIITSSIAFTHNNNGRIYTPVVTPQKSGTGHRLISLYPGMTTKDLIESINSNAPFVDEKSFSEYYDLAITINEMRAGIRQMNANRALVEFGEIGAWKIPHARYWFS